MIPDPDLSLYNLYNIERSSGKMMKGMFHGGIRKMSKGKKLFKKKIKQDGNSNRIGADFLINEDGQIVHAYYGKYIGDHCRQMKLKNLLIKTVISGVKAPMYSLYYFCRSSNCNKSE